MPAKVNSIWLLHVGLLSCLSMLATTVQAVALLGSHSIEERQVVYVTLVDVTFYYS